ncbi:oligopeptide ABC superfamily ATP binding cassette transporter, substrate-binding lipoprotein [Schleiferilactobacillus perolens DSM 12744]|jgi:oligopeptide transport system substrate-binding protein|uniref:Oligopeptide ABC superfamily ATP binding cassette transporter, substrate-binding lipoprotein n=2 Tax=Schleiferilactobacillus perolens TaxID=100468 RepID=A0A0R1MV41_9LACO|nr:oligopeptide ABC superfamily ATP binding cassette transporter, substrate-binding lipoprotein [Schleiferilactobacillus perolens DSM 12744]
MTLIIEEVIIMKKTYGVKIAAAATVAVALLSACSGNKSSSTGSTGAKTTWSRMEGDIISTMDPSLITDAISGQAATDTMAGLYRYDGSDLQPDLATAVVKPTNSGKTYTFKIRNAKWSNGDAITANDFVFGWRRTVDPATKSQYAYLYSGIENADAIMAGKKKASTLGIKAVNKSTVEVTLEHAIPYFETMLVNPAFFPQSEKAVDQYGSKYGTQSKYLVFSGPYKLVGWNGTNNSWKETKNDSYWDKKNVHIDQINVTAIKDPSTAYNLFKSGKLDDASLTGDQAAQAKSDPSYQGVKQASTFYLEMNEKKIPAFKNTKIRQAISMTINREEYIKKVLQDGSIVAPNLTPSGLATDPATKKDFSAEAAKTGSQYTKYNPKEATKLWTEGLKEAGLKDLNIELLTDDGENSKKTGEYLQNTFEKNLPGLKVSISTVPFKTRLARSTAGQFDMVMGGWSADFPDPITFLDLFTSNNSYNRGKWSNAEYDKLIDESKTTYANNAEKRWDVLLQAQELLTKEQGVIPIYQRVQAHLVKQGKISGLKTTPGGAYDFVGATVKK